MSGGGGLRLGVGDLLNRPGIRREVERDLPSEGFTVSASSVPAGATIEARLVVEATAEPGTLTVSGTFSAPWVGECRRCLTNIEGTLESEVHEVVARNPVDDEVWPLEGDEIDIGELAREALMLALPLAPLCGPECRGPAPEAFPAVAVDDASAVPTSSDGEASVDPRWAALDELRFDD